jgi:hypothetical protein
MSDWHHWLAGREHDVRDKEHTSHCDGEQSERSNGHHRLLPLKKSEHIPAIMYEYLI